MFAAISMFATEVPQGMPVSPILLGLAIFVVIIVVRISMHARNRAIQRGISDRDLERIAEKAERTGRTGQGREDRVGVRATRSDGQQIWAEGHIQDGEVKTVVDKPYQPGKNRKQRRRGGSYSTESDDYRGPR